VQNTVEVISTVKVGFKILKFANYVEKG